jgi:hypothetical protein
LTEGHSIRKVTLALGVSRQTIRKFGRARPEREHESKQGESIALVSPHLDAEVFAPWEQLIDWVGVRAAVTSGAIIKQVHAEKAPEVNYTVFRRGARLPRRRSFYDSRINQVRGPKWTIATESRSWLSRRAKFGRSSFSSGSAVLLVCLWRVCERPEVARFHRITRGNVDLFRGLTQSVVVDNLKSGVKRAHRYDPDVNPTYCDCGNHQGMAVLPARPYKRRDKACVEATVEAIYRDFSQGCATGTSIHSQS